MFRTCLILMCAAALSACQFAASTTPTPAVAVSPSPVEVTPTLPATLALRNPPGGRSRWLYDEMNIQFMAEENAASSAVRRVNYVTEGLSISLERPDGWTVHTTDDGIILIERAGPITDGGELQGMMATVFVPSLEEFTLPVSDGANRAFAVLNQVTKQQSYVGAALVTQPRAFEWNGYGAAYYLMNSGTGAMGIVLAVTSPLRHRLLAFNISAPAYKAAAIRPMLPTLLKDLSINGVSYGSGDLTRLPDPLGFPQRDANGLGISR